MTPVVRGMSSRQQLVAVASALAAVLLVVWMRLLPLSLAGLDAAAKAQLRHRGADGREHTYLGDYDSYAWLHFAENELTTGTSCDAVEDGICRDTYSNAPVGRRELYAHSLHVTAIVAVNRIVNFFRPGYPLTASAFLVPVLVGALGVVPAFVIGWRLGGAPGAVLAAVLIGVNPLFLKRSFGSDNDVWNVFLPLGMNAAAIAAIGTRRWRGRFAYGLVAAVCAGLHAVTWRGWLFTYGLLVAGLFAHLVVVAARRWRRERQAGVFHLMPVRDAAMLLLVLIVATGVVADLAGSTDRYWHSPVDFVGNVLEWFSPAQATSENGAPPWPNALATVGEMARLGLDGIAGFMGGRLLFLVGWLGLWLLALPPGAWRGWHWALLVVGGGLGLVLVYGRDPGRAALFVLLLAPAVAALLFAMLAADDAEETDTAAAFLMILWFVGALCLAYGGLRYIMLLAPPFGIACGAAVGRLYQRLSRIAQARWPSFGLIRPTLAVISAALLIAPVQRGYAVASSYRPAMNDAWWDTLSKIRQESPRNAIVTTWWDYGYWAKYVAARRVTADGGSLLTHVPHWLGRALLAPTERESVGLLRMLDCASDATPEPEGSRSAYAALTTHGLDGISAHALILALARLDRDGARSVLAQRGFDTSTQEQVLGAMHCPPPPAYLVLTSALEKIAAWRRLGDWDPGRRYVRRVVSHMPEEEAVATMARRFGYAREDALGLYRQAVRDLPPAAPRRIVGLARGYLHRGWLPCRSEVGDVVCPIGLPIDAAGTVLDDFVYSPDKPSEGRLRIRRPNEEGVAPRTTMWPAELVLADAAGLKRIAPTVPIDHDLAVLLDTVRRRVLLGTPAVIESTFTQLMFLDGRYARHFEKIDERLGYKGERVVAWRVLWPPS